MDEINTAQQLVEQIAGLSIWGFDNNDGEPYAECDEPSDGYLDSHYALMDMIENARRILKTEVSA